MPLPLKKSAVIGLPAQASAKTPPQTLSVIPVPPPGVDPEVVPCRPKSQLPMFYGIISSFSTGIDANTGGILVELFINPKHQISPAGPPPPPCKNSLDGFFFLPQYSSNIAGYSILYLVNIGAVQVLLFPADPTQCMVLGFRLRFEENFNVTHQYTPRKQIGALKICGNSQSPQRAGTTQAKAAKKAAGAKKGAKKATGAKKQAAAKQFEVTVVELNDEQG